LSVLSPEAINSEHSAISFGGISMAEP